MPRWGNDSNDNVSNDNCSVSLKRQHWFCLSLVFCLEQKFGFASCDRNVGAAEGVNVLAERQREDGQWECGITCVEYTEFEKLGIADTPVSSGRYAVWTQGSSFPHTVSAVCLQHARPAPSQHHCAFPSVALAFPSGGARPCRRLSVPFLLTIAVSACAPFALCLQHARPASSQHQCALCRSGGREGGRPGWGAALHNTNSR